MRSTPGARDAARVAIVSDPDPADLAALPALEWIHSLWAGVETLLDGVDERVGIVRLVDPALSHAMTEAVLAWTLYLHRDVPRYLAQQRERGRGHTASSCPPESAASACWAWASWAGRAPAPLAAHGFDVAGLEPLAEVHRRRRDVHHGDAGLDALLVRSDVLVVLLPLTGDTRGLLDGAGPGPAARGRLPRQRRARADRRRGGPADARLDGGTPRITRCSTCSTSSRCPPITRSGRTRA